MKKLSDNQIVQAVSETAAQLASGNAEARAMEIVRQDLRRRQTAALKRRTLWSLGSAAAAVVLAVFSASLPSASNPVTAQTLAKSLDSAEVSQQDQDKAPPTADKGDATSGERQIQRNFLLSDNGEADMALRLLLADAAYTSSELEMADAATLSDSTGNADTEETLAQADYTAAFEGWEEMSLEEALIVWQEAPLAIAGLF